VDRLPLRRRRVDPRRLRRPPSAGGAAGGAADPTSDETPASATGAASSVLPQLNGLYHAPPANRAATGTRMRRVMRARRIVRRSPAICLPDDTILFPPPGGRRCLSSSSTGDVLFRRDLFPITTSVKSPRCAESGLVMMDPFPGICSNAHKPFYAVREAPILERK
jgi:hypothetical protein